MNYPSKRLTLNAHLMTPDVVPTMVEYGYDTLMIFFANSDTTEYVAALEPALSQAEEYGLQVLISCGGEIGGDVPGGSKNPTWTVSTYEAAYGAIYDVLEADSRIDGYFSETPTYVGSQWLAGRTSKLTQYLYVCCTQNWPHFADILNLYDEVVYEAFTPIATPPEFPSLLPSIHSIKPTLKIGIMDQTEEQDPTDSYTYWSDYSDWFPLHPPPVPYATQQSCAITAFNATNAAMISTFGHKLDFNVVQYAGVSVNTVTSTLSQVIAWHEAQHITYTGTPIKPVQQMNQKGHIPAYGGAAICTYPATSPLVDTFTNTGNEIIMLKNAGSSCNVHAITVTGTSATQNYTIAIPPDRATFLGPYSTDEFGTLPTITYDNTNLYISIVGET